MRDSKEAMIAAIWTAGFGAITYIMLVVEPSMGFHTPADYADPEKILGAFESVAWTIADLAYLLIGLAAVGVSLQAHDRILRLPPRWRGEASSSSERSTASSWIFR